MHHAVDDHSRLPECEILSDERKETATAFWTWAHTFFASLGIEVTAVMSDHGACHRSKDFATALGQIQHRRTRSYRPQTNRKVERFNRTLATERAYTTTDLSDAARAATYEARRHHDNHHRPHTGAGCQTPSARVHNLTGKYS